jgi:acetyl esterase/lipase
MSHPPFDPELHAARTAEPLSYVPSTITPEMIAPMQQTRPVIDPDELIAGTGIVHEERVVPGPQGAPDMTVSIFHRADRAAVGPGVYFIHGGGMIAGQRLDGVAAFFTHVIELDAVVVTVDYRLAPGNPDPAPVEDCYAGLLWMSDHADQLGFDPARLVIGGISAGAGLAAGTTLLSRDRQGPAPVAQVLICPMLDDRNESVSSRQIDGVGVWDRTSNETGWTALLGSRRGGPDVSIYASPARATDLAGLPPTYIDVGSAEVFRDEAVAYADKMWAAGGEAELHVWSGGFHGFEFFVPTSQLALRARECRDQWLRLILAR